jgi:hypothetical protein
VAKESEIFTLHKYFVWANRMRTHFDELLLKKEKDKKSSNDLFDVEVNLYMSYWYGGLYVVIEGWKELKLTDKKIDRLLNSPNVKLLRRYRNGVFHFQKNYFDKRFVGFIRDGKDCVNWIRTLNKEFGRYFLAWYKNKSPSE